MHKYTMSERDTRAAGSAEGSTGDGAARNRAGDTLDRLDDAQVMELVSNAYWTLLERFISLDGEGTSIPSITSAS